MFLSPVPSPGPQGTNTFHIAVKRRAEEYFHPDDDQVISWDINYRGYKGWPEASMESLPCTSHNCSHYFHFICIIIQYKDKYWLKNWFCRVTSFQFWWHEWSTGTGYQSDKYVRKQRRISDTSGWRMCSKRDKKPGEDKLRTWSFSCCLASTESNVKIWMSSKPPQPFGYLSYRNKSIRLVRK